MSMPKAVQLRPVCVQICERERNLSLTSVVTVLIFLLVVGFGRFCGKNLGYGFGFGFSMKAL